MSLDTNTDVEEIRSVQDEQGNTQAAANEAEQKQMNAALGNQPSVGAFSYSTSSTSAEQLPSNTVPDGVEVVVQADPSNTDPIKVGNADVQPATIKGTEAVTLAVEDTSAIYVRAQTSGDSVGVIFEEGA